MVISSANLNRYRYLVKNVFSAFIIIMVYFVSFHKLTCPFRLLSFVIIWQLWCSSFYNESITAIHVLSHRLFYILFVYFQQIPKYVAKSCNVRVEIKRKHLMVSYRNTDDVWCPLVDDDLTWDINKEESLWTMVPHKHIHVTFTIIILCCILPGS